MKKKSNSKPNLLLLHGAQLLEQFLQALRKTSGIDLQGPVVELFQLAAQLEHGLLPIADQFLQILVAQLLACPALARALSAAFQLCLHIDLFRGSFAAWFASPLAAFLAFLLSSAA